MLLDDLGYDDERLGDLYGANALRLERQDSAGHVLSGCGVSGTRTGSDRRWA